MQQELSTTEVIVSEVQPEPAVDEFPGIPNDLIELSAAASIIGVSAQTLRRMEDRGKISARRTSGGHRRYLTHDALRLQKTRPIEIYRGQAPKGVTSNALSKLISADDAAKQLGISRPTLRRWEREGKLVAHRNKMGKKVLFDKESIDALVNSGA
jgi:excisionase family DNA binding protein